MRRSRHCLLALALTIVLFPLALVACDDDPSGTGTSSSSSAGSTSASTGSAMAYGHCTGACSAPADCCPAGEPTCPGPGWPNNWECAMGACVAPHCTSTGQCIAVDTSLDCRPIGGVFDCVTPCAGDGDCKTPATCSGVDDDGLKYCVAPIPPCTDDPSCGGFGHCMNGSCVCTTDGDCTAMGSTHCGH